MESTLHCFCACSMQGWFNGMSWLQRAGPINLHSRKLTLCPHAAALWGQDSLWLHVDADNDAALRLYAAAGFSLHMEDGGWFGLPHRRLLRRPLRPRRPTAAACSPNPRSEGQSSEDVVAEDRPCNRRPGSQGTELSGQGERGHVGRLELTDGAPETRGSGTYAWKLGKEDSHVGK